MSNIWKYMWEALPPGFRFHPTDEEFVNHYLTNYIHGINDLVDVIPIVNDLYKQDPSELPRLFRGLSIIRSTDPEWWFLSELRYKCPNADKFDRSTSKGSWKITGKPKEIHNRGVNRQIAEMRNLVFCENPRNEETNWVIHEYYLRDSSLGHTLREQRKYVLCHLVNRQYDYTETSMDMEVDLEFEEPQHIFLEGLLSPATNAPLHNPRESYATLFPITAVSPVVNFNEMEHVMSSGSGNNFYMEEESSHSDEFDASFYEQLLEPKETSQAASNHAVVKKNQQVRPPGTLEGYVVINETRGFVEDDFQREEASDVSSLPDSPKTPPTKYPMASLKEHSVCNLRRMEARSADFRGYDHRSTSVIERPQSTPSGRYHNFKEGKAKAAQIAGTEPRSLTQEVRRNPSTRPQTLRPRAGNEKIPITSREKNQADGGCRPPFDYLINLGAGIVLLVLMILWLLRY